MLEELSSIDCFLTISEFTKNELKRLTNLDHNIIFNILSISIKRDIKRKTSYNQSEITNVYSDNNEGLSDRMPSEQFEED